MEELTNQEIEEIEAYLQQRMNEEQVTSIEQRMKDDPGFVQKVNVFKTVIGLVKVHAHQSRNQEMGFIQEELAAEIAEGKGKRPFVYIGKKDKQLILFFIALLGLFSLVYWVGFKIGKQTRPVVVADLDPIAEVPSGAGNLPTVLLEKHSFQAGKETVTEQSMSLLLVQSEEITTLPSVSMVSGTLRLSLADTANVTPTDIRLFEGRHEELGASSFYLKIVSEYYKIDWTAQAEPMERIDKENLPDWIPLTQ